MVRRPPQVQGSYPIKRTVPGPRYPLANEVLPVVRLASLGKKRAVREVEARLGVSEPEAEHYIRTTLGGLKETDYVETVEMEWDSTVVADVYGIADVHGGWYVKLYVEHGRIQVASFHEPEHDLTCTDGKIIRKGKSDD
jgi:hypothetical protein